MDTVTHALFGALSAQTVTPRFKRLSHRERLILGAAAGALPDIDFLGFLFNPLVFLADWHQGPTHSLLLLPVWAALAGKAFAWLIKQRNAWREATLIAGLAWLSHILLDLITAYGTQLLSPLSAQRIRLDLVFVIDPVFTGIVLLTLLLSLRLEKPRIAIAITGLTVLVSYVLALALLQRQALNLGKTFTQLQNLNNTQVLALPQPFSPFNWMIIIASGDHYYRAWLNLAGHSPLVPDLPALSRLRAIAESYRAPDKLDWQHWHRHGEERYQALASVLWQHPEFEPFRRFAALPSLSRIDSSNDTTCVWFTDLRYDLPALPDTFRYGFCRNDAGEAWQLYRLRYFSENRKQRLSAH
ncbi:MAG: metal-dependent hydrolase [Methylomicrobium sp.]|nr:metal-dependent hydrolase [Methylomicrobium sp.]